MGTVIETHGMTETATSGKSSSSRQLLTLADYRWHQEGNLLWMD